jgi:hypothetical protein
MFTMFIYIPVFGVYIRKAVFLNEYKDVEMKCKSSRTFFSKFKDLKIFENGTDFAF